MHRATDSSATHGPADGPDRSSPKGGEVDDRVAASHASPPGGGVDDRVAAGHASPGSGDAASPPPSGGATVPRLPRGVREVREIPRQVEGLEVWEHPGWSADHPWLVQGVTGRKGPDGPDEPFDMALFGSGAAGRVTARWSRLGDALGFPRQVHGRQVHRAAVRFHDDGPPGIQLLPDTDGHVTRSSGVLLAVATADCIPAIVVDPSRKAVAALHAGWRGLVGGILERGLEVLAERVASRAADVHVHLGPAICGRCYEVGPEVHEGLGLDIPPGPRPVDLRAAAAGRLVAAGVPAESVTVSAWCTRCGDSPFFSHRGGCAERQIGFVGIAD